MADTELLNFRIPTTLKQQFQDTCKNRNVAMTFVLCEAVFDYVREDEKIQVDDWEPIIYSSDETTIAAE